MSQVLTAPRYSTGYHLAIVHRCTAAMTHIRAAKMEGCDSSSTVQSSCNNNNRTYFEVNVSRDTFKFNAAHFVAYQGFRERLHGHNYRVSVRLLGSRSIGADGYVIDFGCVKAITKQVCKDLNEHFLCPTRSNVLTITTTTTEDEGENGDAAADDEAEKRSIVKVVCEDGSTFVFPRVDCAMLPIVHATAEELAIYVWGEILKGLNDDYLLARGIHTMEVTVSEAPGQDATFRMGIPGPESEVNRDQVCDVSRYVSNGNVIPMPCASTTEDWRGNKNKKRIKTEAPPDNVCQNDCCIG
eukprot:scaffold166152_cov51-Attheya_sp.AAC.1